MSEKTIRIACRGALEIDYRELNAFQGNLKNLSRADYEKLRGEILETGFAFAPHAWLNPDDSKWYLVDGHQRIRCVKEMTEVEGYACPLIPVVPVEARDFKEAKRRVLQGTSAYGQMTPEGIHEFIVMADIPHESLDSFRLPEVDIDDFRTEFFDAPKAEKPAEPEAPQVPEPKMERCPQCGFDLKP